jgi:hypothetical protein
MRSVRHVPERRSALRQRFVIDALEVGGQFLCGCRPAPPENRAERDDFGVPDQTVGDH